MMRGTHRQAIGCVTSACLLVLAPLITAAADAETSSWTAWARAFYATSDADIRVDSRTLDVSGTLIDFEDDLGVDRRKALPMFGLQWRFAERHSVGLAYFELRRSGRAILEDEIRWGNAVYPVSADISSFFDTKVARLAYRYDFAPGERVDVWIGGGIHVTEMSAGVSEATLGGVDVSHSAPLPMFTGALDFHLAPKWTLVAMAEWFGIEIGDIEGGLSHADLALRWQTWQKVGLSVGYNYFELDFEQGDADFKGLFDYSYKGPFLGVDVAF